MSTKRLMMIAVTAALLATVAGCGRKAPLDTPYEAAVDARKQAQKNNEPLPPEPTPPVKDRKFILDGLIQ